MCQDMLIPGYIHGLIVLTKTGQKQRKYPSQEKTGKYILRTTGCFVAANQNKADLLTLRIKASAVGGALKVNKVTKLRRICCTPHPDLTHAVFPSLASLQPHWSSAPQMCQVPSQLGLGTALLLLGTPFPLRFTCN